MSSNLNGQIAYSGSHLHKIRGKGKFLLGGIISGMSAAALIPATLEVGIVVRDSEHSHWSAHSAHRVDRVATQDVLKY